jgi:hypothetical protein
LNENARDPGGSANTLGVWFDSGINGADCGSDLATLIENVVDHGEIVLDDFLGIG